MPYPYTLMPDGHTMEPDFEPPKPPATTQEESTSENDSPPASTSSTTPESDPVTGPLPFGTEPSPFATPEYTQYGQPPSTEADAKKREERIEKLRKRFQDAKRSATNVQSASSGSRIKEVPDISEAEDDAIVLSMLPDIETVEDDLGINGMVPDIRLDRLSAYSNLDIVRVRQDMEHRPLTFKRCFEQSQSPRIALEFLYADPPDCNDSEKTYLQREIERQSEIGVGRGGDTDVENGNEPVGVGSAMYHSVYRDEQYLQFEYGFDIKWDEQPSSSQLNNLANAVDFIVNYLSQEVYDGDRDRARSAFRQYFSHNEHGQLVVQLGADTITGGAGLGYVPLPASSTTDLDTIFLGSLVDIPTIVHEFGHVIDRSKGFTSYLTEIVAPAGMSRMATASEEYGEEYGDLSPAYYSFNLDAMLYKEIIEGFVAKQYFPQERWADLFMTAVLDPNMSGEEFTVESIDDINNDIEIFKAFTNPLVIFECGIDAPCAEKPVKWVDSRRAEVAQWYLPIVFRELLSR